MRHRQFYNGWCNLLKSVPNKKEKKKKSVSNKILLLYMKFFPIRFELNVLFLSTKPWTRLESCLYKSHHSAKIQYNCALNVTILMDPMQLCIGPILILKLCPRFGELETIIHVLGLKYWAQSIWVGLNVRFNQNYNMK